MPESYRKKSKMQRISDTVEFKHQRITSPAPTPEDGIIHSSQQLTAVLKGDGVGASEAQLKSIEAMQETLNKWSEGDATLAYVEYTGLDKSRRWCRPG